MDDTFYHSTVYTGYNYVVVIILKFDKSQTLSNHQINTSSMKYPLMSINMKATLLWLALVVNTRIKIISIAHALLAREKRK